ncbi:MAG: hypothetical protein Harvfovirus1_39 [Harvfovirus sp.]|uniref:Uncharacterized protein n=1 Tax=Harvfovirus sp. TaxID=2487768 RepID=A0A3G5A1N6_9VIRU|nr:MAG: hypothetical protein Harvfovirus1_39 [Harvfovirus sp.]
MTVQAFNATTENKLYIISGLFMISTLMMYFNALLYKFYLYHLRIYIQSGDETKFIPLTESEKNLMNEIDDLRYIRLLRRINFIFLCFITCYSIMTFNIPRSDNTIGLNNLTFAYVFNFLIEFPHGMWGSYQVKIVMILCFACTSFVNLIIMILFMIKENHLILFEYNIGLILFEVLFLIMMVGITICCSWESKKYVKSYNAKDYGTV